MAPLKILITDPHLNGGGQVRYVLSLARTLPRIAECEIVVGCKPGSILARQGRDAGTRVLDAVTFRGGLRPRAWLSDIARVRRFIRDERPNIIHVNGSQDHWVCALANRSLGKPVCIVRSRHNTYAVKNTLANRILNRYWTGYQIAVCEYVRLELSKHPAFDPARMCSIHNGVDPGEYRPDPQVRAQMRAEFGARADHVVVGIVARLVKDKGHAFLLRAVASLKDAVPELRVLVLGEGPLDAELRALTAELGIGGRVMFAGYRTDVDRCIQAFDIGVQPSIGCDTSSFSTKEQMAAEIPVIVSSHGGLPELVEEGFNGYIVPAGTIEPLAQRLAQLARDAQLRRTLGQNGRTYVMGRFQESLFASRTLDAYRAALKMERER